MTGPGLLQKFSIDWLAIFLDYRMLSSKRFGGGGRVRTVERGIDSTFYFIFCREMIKSRAATGGPFIEIRRSHSRASSIVVSTPGSASHHPGFMPPLAFANSNLSTHMAFPPSLPVC
ncbi:MAG: hypothetical protein DMF63_03000 [Acidobacteria bacterium]|nr:MAG: hypothetical protein DMF63_03000 [Acidobacteriota bacterium]